MASGYRMPAEWERHSRTWMGWPQRPDNWRDGAKPAQGAYAEVARAISQFEDVTVCANADQVAVARGILPVDGGNVEVVHLPQDDAWFRDTAPTFVTRQGGLAGVIWDFNGWGGDVLPAIDADKQIAGRILQRSEIEAVKANIVLEGGSIHVDGEGTLLTTEECLLHPNRNPGLSKQQISDVLCKLLGVRKVIWLPFGLVADEDTNGHIDNFACFAQPGVVLLAWPSVDDPEQLKRSEAALEMLESSTDACGRQIQVVKVPLPPPLHYEAHEAIHDPTTGAVLRGKGVRLAASYINFYLCNGGVIMPAFGGKATDSDAEARRILEKVFPDRRVVAIKSAREILLGGGNIHCITQQQPAFEP